MSGVVAAVVAGVVGLGAALGCGRIGYDPLAAASDGGPDGPPGEADAAAPPGSLCGLPDGTWTFAPPVRVAELSTAAYEREPVLSADGLTVHFASAVAGSFDVYRATRATPGAPFGVPVLEPLAESDPGRDETRFAIAHDGLDLYLSREHPDGAGSADLWTASRASVDDPFGPLTVIGSTGSALYEWDPWPVGSRVYFARNDAPDGLGQNDLFVVERDGPGAPYGAPVPVDAVNSADYTEDNPTLNQDETLIIFASERPGSAGGKDLWYATRPDRDAPFGAPERVPVLNTAFEEDEPSLSADGCELWFAAATDRSLLDLYRARIVAR